MATKTPGAAHPQHEPLVQAHGKLIGHKKRVDAGRRQLVRRAQQQLDSMADTIRTVEQHVEQDAGGGVLAQRRLKTLLAERHRLIVFLAKHEHRLEGFEHEVDDDADTDTDTDKGDA